MSDVMEVVLRELGQTLSVLRVFLLEEEGVLVGGDIDCVRNVLSRREAFLVRIETLSQRYQLLHMAEEAQPVPTQEGEEQQQLIQAIKTQASAVAYQNRVNAQILHLRQTELSAAVCVFPSWVAQEAPLYGREGHYTYSVPRRQALGGPSTDERPPEVS